jgi:hypothetical protein
MLHHASTFERETLESSPMLQQASTFERETLESSPMLQQASTFERETLESPPMLQQASTFERATTTRSRSRRHRRAGLHHVEVHEARERMARCSPSMPL